MISFFSILFLVKITTALFPNHLDLQNVGVAILNDEKYNILKPTIHKVTDHFKDFILRRGNAGTIFLDDNGLRHVWSSFDAKDMRRTDEKTPGGAGARTKGRVYFFCPFLGVISMNAFVEP